MRRSIPIGMMILVAVISSGCASGLQQRLDDQQALIDAMQAQIDEVNASTAEQSQETDAIQRDMQQIGMKVTQNEEQISSMNNRVENLHTRVSLLTDEVTRLKTGAAQPAQPAGTPLQFTETTGATPGSVQALYDGALRLYYTEEPASVRSAIGEFAKVLEAAPNSDLADNADYWTGECYYKLEELPQALEAFKRVFNHQFEDKYDDAQLKIGMTYRLMGQRDQALAAFRELVEKYDESPYLEHARRHIRELGGGGSR